MITHPQIDKVVNASGESFTISRHECHHFYNKFHMHQEFEITYIERGAGQRWVGDHAESFEDGDLIMTGAWTPHVWINNIETENQTYQKLSFVLLQFNEDSLSRGFFDLPEMKKIRQLLDFSARGLKITGPTAESIRLIMKQMLCSNGPLKITGLIKLLDLLSQSVNIQPLASEKFVKRFAHNRSTRLNGIHLYLLQHIDQHFKLEDIAVHTGMNKSSLCRYFKEETGKTISNYFMELKIQYACLMLGNSSTNNVKEIAFQCGFSSPSYFNRQFRRSLNLTPLQYQKLLKNRDV